MIGCALFDMSFNHIQKYKQSYNIISKFHSLFSFKFDLYKRNYTYVLAEYIQLKPDVPVVSVQNVGGGGGSEGVLTISWRVSH